MNISIKDLSLYRGKRRILNGLSAEIKSGRFTVILGKNGCGKSTLVSALASALSFEGQILLDGRALSEYSPRERARMIAITPQLPRRAGITVGELIAFGRSPYLSLGERMRGEDIDAVNEAIELFELSELRDARIDRISGGELRRAYIAMSFAQQTPVLVLDEPCAHTDERNRARILELLSRLVREKGRTVVAVMHDISDALSYADDVIIMDGGRFVSAMTAEMTEQSGVIEKTFGITKYVGTIWGIPKNQ